MGIFGGGYNKPGPGVDKNEPKKRGFFLYIDILWHKCMKLLGANCMYAVSSLLWLFILVVVGRMVFTGTGINDNIVANIVATLTSDAEFTAEEIGANVSVLLDLFFAVMVFTLWGSGPASASYSYIHRCFTRGEHAWIVSDGFDKFKQNFKQGMFVVIVDFVILVLGINAIYFYHELYAQSGSILWMFLIYLMILVLLVYTMMHPYLYQIMVTFDCKIGALYKNALLLSLGKLPLNLLFTLTAAALVFIVFNFISNPVISVLLMLIFGMSFTAFPREFYAARVIERTILKDMNKKPAPPKIEYIGEDE